MFSESKHVNPQWRGRVHMVARLTKISNTSRYFRVAKWEALFKGLRVFISGNPVVFLCGQIKPCCSLCIMLYSLLFRNLTLFYSNLNSVLVFKLSAVHCCTRATISIQRQLYRYSYRQISVTIHRCIEHRTSVHNHRRIALYQIFQFNSLPNLPKMY